MDVEKIFIEYLNSQLFISVADELTLFNYVTKEPAKAANGTTAAAKMLDGHVDDIKSVAITISHHIQRVVDLVKKVKNDWDEFTSPLSKYVASIPIQYRPYILREGLDYIENGQFVKAIIEKMSNKDLLDTIVESVRQKENLEDVRTLTFFLLPSPDQRAMAYRTLPIAFKEVAIEERDYLYIMGDNLWKHLSFDEKTTVLLKKYVTGLGDVDELISVLRELLIQREYKKIEIILNKIVLHLANRDVVIRKAATKALISFRDLLSNYDTGESMSKKISSILCPRLEDEDEEIRNIALDSLIYPGNEEVYPYLLRAIRRKGIYGNSTFNDYRARVIESIGFIGNDTFVQELSKLLKAKSFFTVVESSEIRIAVIRAIGKIGGDEARRILENASATDSREAVREESKRVLEEMRT